MADASHANRVAMSERRTVLLVDDDPGTLHVLQRGLSTVLDLTDVVTAGNGREALEILEKRTIDVLVTDLAMPVLDGFFLIAAVNNRFPSLPVVVLSGMTRRDLDARLAGYRGLSVLTKPADYHDVATAIVDALERVELGQVEGIPLTAVLQLVESERRSCRMLVTSGLRKGRLYFDAGQLVNAFSEDFGAEGEAAAYDILGWDDTVIEFGHLPEDVRRLIDMPMQLMLIDVAAQQDHDHAFVQRLARPVRIGEPAGAAAYGRGPEHRTLDMGAGPRAADPDEEGAMSFGDDRPSEADPSEAEASGGHDASDAALLAPPRPAVPDGPLDGPAPAPEGAVSAAPAALEPHAAQLIEAMDRLAHRIQAADEALAAVGDEVAAFREAQRLFDEVAAARERRRAELEVFREEVSRLAREILGRVDGLFGDHPPIPMHAEPEHAIDRTIA
jgi:CheY-like chemotaxis protein